MEHCSMAWHKLCTSGWVSQWISSVTTFQGIPRNCNLWLARVRKQHVGHVSDSDNYSRIIPVYFFQEKTLQYQVFGGFSEMCKLCWLRKRISNIPLENNMSHVFHVWLLSTWKVEDCTKTKIRVGIFQGNLSPFSSREGQSTHRNLLLSMQQSFLIIVSNLKVGDMMVLMIWFMDWVW